MNSNAEFIRITRTLKTVFGILSIVGAPIALLHAILAGNFYQISRIFSDVVMSGLLLAGGITMLVGRSKVERGGVAPIVLFSLALFFGIFGLYKHLMWFWILWCAGCLFGSIYSRVSMSRIARGEQVQFDPMGAARTWGPAAADAVRGAAGAAANVAGAAVNIASDVAGAARDAYYQTRERRQNDAYQNWQAQTDGQWQPQQEQQPQAPWDRPQQPYVPQAAQAAQQGYSPVFDVQPPKTMAQGQQEILDRKAAEAEQQAAAEAERTAAQAAQAAAEAAAAAAEMQAPASPFAASEE